MFSTCLTTLRHESWWSTTPWTARTTWRWRPGRTLTSGCTNKGWNYRMWYAVTMVSDMRVFYICFQLSDHFEYIRVGGRRQRGTRTRTRTTSRKVGFITLVGVRMVDALIFFIYSIFKYSIFNIQLKVVCVDDRRHCGWQGHLDGQWHHDVSLSYKFFIERGAVKTEVHDIIKF